MAVIWNELGRRAAIGGSWEKEDEPNINH